MNPVTKKLLAKKYPTGADIGRLLIGNMIDVYKGDGLPSEKIRYLLQFLKTEKDSMEYGLYRSVFYSLDENRDICAEKISHADTASAGLQMFYENVLFANSAYPRCKWPKYNLAKMTPETRSTGFTLWLRLRNCLRFFSATRGAFMAASAWLKIPDLESILPDEKLIRPQVENLDQLAMQAREKLLAKNLPESLQSEICEIFNPLACELNLPSQKEILEAKKSMKLQTFAVNLEEAIDTMNPYAAEEE